MHLGDADVVVELTVSKKKKNICDRNDFTSKPENLKNEEKIFLHILFSIPYLFSCHYLLMLKIWSYLKFYICE